MTDPVMGHDELCARVPHDGAMCLLEEVMHWDETQLQCRATSHRDADNPLRKENRLHAVTGVEYAGQAMALHGGLTAGDAAPRRGYLASIRDLKIRQPLLSDIKHDLLVSVTRLTAGEDSFMYQFEITANGESVLSGRAAVKLV